MRFYLLIGSVIWCFTACSLSAKQEKSLNRAIIQYQNAYNKELTILEVSQTHPCIIDAHLSDTAGLKKLFIHHEETINNFSIISIVKRGEQMKVKLSFDYLSSNTQTNSSKKIIYALSSNLGESWFFLEAKHLKYVDCSRFKNN